MESNDKKLEDFVKKMMSNAVLEKPSVNFTDSVLQNIKTQSNTTVYRSLIPKWVWTVTIVLSVMLSFYMFFSKESSSSIISEYLSFIKLDMPFKTLEFNFSKTVVYSMLALAVMLCFQVPILKNYLNKNMQF